MVPDFDAFFKIPQIKEFSLKLHSTTDQDISTLFTALAGHAAVDEEAMYEFGVNCSNMQEDLWGFYLRGGCGEQAVRRP